MANILTKPWAYYNDSDPFVCAWAREIIKTGLVAPGEVDERPIEQVQPEDLNGFTQCHFFCGILGWSYALRLAGWDDDRPVWTGSCPCQPFSTSGKGATTTDPRHLWPAWFQLIRECQPDAIFGEQVSSPDGLAWFDVVSADLEGANYAIGAADLCAAGIGCPTIGQRLWFVAEAESVQQSGTAQRRQHSGEVSAAGPHGGASAGRSSGTRGMAASYVAVTEDGSLQPGWRLVQPPTNALAGFWDGADWIYCRDGRWRPVEPGTFPLAHGLPVRLGRLRGYGNSIVPDLAATFIAAYRDVIEP